MNELNKYSESDRLVCYQQQSGDIKLSMIFNKEIKSVDVCLSIFHRINEPTLEPMNDCEKYSSDKGHWQTETACLGIEDIEFLYKKSRELFR